MTHLPVVPLAQEAPQETPRCTRCGGLLRLDGADASCDTCEVRSCRSCGVPLPRNGLRAKCRGCMRVAAVPCGYCGRPLHHERARVSTLHVNCELRTVAAPLVTREQLFTFFQEPKLPGASLAEHERWIILRTLVECQGSTTQAAKMLQISTRKIQYRLGEYRSAWLAAHTAKPRPEQHGGVNG